jgi:hypothetical protein
MNDSDDVDAWLDANAALLGMAIAPEWRDPVCLYLRITRDHAQRVMSFELPDEADSAPVFQA